MARTTPLSFAVGLREARFRTDGVRPQFLLIGRKRLKSLVDSNDFSAVMRVLGHTELSTPVIEAVLGVLVVVDEKDPERLTFVQDAMTELTR